MRELKATDKITQKMTRDGAVSENLATGEVEHISSREPETELSASSEESAGAVADLALPHRTAFAGVQGHQACGCHVGHLLEK